MRARLSVVALLAVSLLTPAAGAAAEPLPFRVPDGYRVTHRERIADGVEHVRLESRRPVHVVELGFTKPRSGYRVEVRHAGPRSDGPDRELSGTSELCGDCAYATNADYAWRQPSRVVGRPIGGIVARGVVLVSPETLHQQASYTYAGGFTTRRLTWAATATATAGDRALAVTGKNVPRGAGQLVLYTADYVRRTGTDGGAELTLALPRRASNVRPNEPVVGRMLALREGGDGAVRPGTVVLSGHGRHAVALRLAWARAGRGGAVELAETLSPGDVWASVGAGHILLRHGRRWLVPENAPHLTATHPRTFAGVMRDGTLFHATVDGRERNVGRSVGMPLEEALAFFRALGAREAVNMDGGGSTTFVRDGVVVNRPSDGGERPVTTALVVTRGRIPRRPQPPRVPPPAPLPPRPRPEQPQLDAVEVAYAAPTALPPVPPVPPPLPLVPLAVATGNVAALSMALTVIWVRRGRPVVP